MALRVHQLAHPTSLLRPRWLTRKLRRPSLGMGRAPQQQVRFLHILGISMQAPSSESHACRHAAQSHVHAGTQLRVTCMQAASSESHACRQPAQSHMHAGTQTTVTCMQAASSQSHSPSAYVTGQLQMHRRLSVRCQLYQILWRG